MRPVLTHIALQVRNLDATIRWYSSYCAMRVLHDRGDDGERVVWLAEPGRERELILVFMCGDARPAQHAKDYSHLGFAVASRTEVDEIAARAKEEGCLVWAPRQESYPVGYYCGLRDPDGYFVEFSYGQPLGPGAEPLAFES